MNDKGPIDLMGPLLFDCLLLIFFSVSEQVAW